MSAAWSFYKDHAGEWRWRRECENGKITAASTEGYKNWPDCQANAVMSGYVVPVVENGVWISESDG